MQNGLKTQVLAFRGWLAARGLVPGTVRIYGDDVTAALEAGDFQTRLNDDDLAPKTRHRIRSAGRQWAEFLDDDVLAKALKNFRLPAAKRQSAKTPIAHSQLMQVVDELAREDYLEPAMHAVIGLLAKRGFRCGDVLRMRRTEILDAQESRVLAYEAKGRKRLEFPVLKAFAPHVLCLAGLDGWTRVEDLIAPHSKAKGRRKAASKAVERALNQVAEKCGIVHLHPHRLRRTYAVEYLSNLGDDPEALMKLTQHMGWASMTTAMEYVDHSRGKSLDAAADRIFER